MSTRIMSISLKPELRERVKRRAAALGISVSRHIRELVSKDLAGLRPGALRLGGRAF